MLLLWARKERVPYRTATYNTRPKEMERNSTNNYAPIEAGTKKPAFLFWRRRPFRRLVRRLYLLNKMIRPSVVRCAAVCFLYLLPLAIQCLLRFRVGEVDGDMPPL